MTDSIKDKHFNAEERAKLKSVVNATVVALQHIDDTRISMNENAQSVADDLELKKSEILDAARQLHKQNVAAKRAKQDAVEELLAVLGYEIEDEPEV